MASTDAPPEEVEFPFESLAEAIRDGFQIVDIREPEELEQIPTPARESTHIPMAQLLHGPQKFEPAGKCLLVCASGRRSLAAALELRSRGLKAIYSLRGGIQGLLHHDRAKV